MLLHWGLSIAFFSVTSFFYLRKRIPVLLAITPTYFFLLSAFLICFRQLGAKLVEGDDLRWIFLLAPSEFSFSMIAVFAFGAAALLEKNIRFWFEYCLKLYAVMAPVLFLCAKQRLLPYNSANATIAALALPYFLPTSTSDALGLFVSLSICLLAAFSNTSCPVGVCSVVILSFYTLRTRERRIKSWLMIAGISLIPIFAACACYGFDYIFNSTGRFVAYKVFFGYWWDDSFLTTLFGYGPGSFGPISQIIQEKTNFMVHWENGRLKGELWIHAHSDWLQLFIEYGLTGGILVLSCFFRLLFDLEDKEKVVLLGIAASAVFDFPFSYPAAPLMVVCLVSMAYFREHPKKNLPPLEQCRRRH